MDTQSAMLLRAMKVIRAHPDWDDEKVAEQAGIHPIFCDDDTAQGSIVKVARRNVEADG